MKVKYLNKVGDKIFRLISGIKIFIVSYLSNVIFPFRFQIIQLKTNAPEVHFNFSVDLDVKNNEYIGMARQYVQGLDLLKNAKIYIGTSLNLFQEFNLVEVDTAILSQFISNFVRVEDPRVLVVDKKIYAICACIITSEPDQNNRKLLVKQIIIEVSNNVVTNFKLLGTNFRIEKNWVPVRILNNHLILLYSLEHNEVVKVSLDFSQRFEELSVKNNSNFIYRNSTNFLEVNGQAFGVGHRVIDLGFKYAYIHFFIKITNLNRVYISKPFVFNKYGNEFATSLVYLKNNNMAIIFSDHDKGNYASVFNPSELHQNFWKLI
jgi:hypothetical protein